jgi:serine/threonine protein kinase
VGITQSTSRKTESDRKSQASRTKKSSQQPANSSGTREHHHHHHHHHRRSSSLFFFALANKKIDTVVIAYSYHQIMVTTRGVTNAAIAQFEYDAKNWKLLPEDFILLKLLGQGGEGSVYHAQHKASGVDVALKRIPFTGMFDNEQESRIHVQLQHPNVLRMYGMFRDDDDVNDSDYDSDYDSDDEDDEEEGKPPPSSCWIILEYCKEGTMQQVMETSGFASGSKREAFVAKNMQAILRAVQYMHGEPHHLLHRDIKPMNLLYNDGEPLLADFGMCASLKQSTTAAAGGAAGRSHEFVGTVIYMAPEVLAMDQKYRAATKKAAMALEHHGGENKNEQQQLQPQDDADEESWRKGYSFEADAWSLGVTTYELLFGQHPFPIHDDQQYTVEMCRYVSNNFAPCDIRFPSDNHGNAMISAEAQHFILSLVQVDPEKRMSIDDALCHPWILRHVKQQHAATPATAMSNLEKANKPAKPRAAENKQVAGNDAAIKQVATAANAATIMSNPDKENKPVVEPQQSQPDVKGKQKSVAVDNCNDDGNDDIAVQQVRARLGGLNINQV